MAVLETLECGFIDVQVSTKVLTVILDFVDETKYFLLSLRVSVLYDSN